MTCQNCGKEYFDKLNYCRLCGEKLVPNESEENSSSDEISSETTTQNFSESCDIPPSLEETFEASEFSKIAELRTTGDENHSSKSDAAISKTSKKKSEFSLLRAIINVVVSTILSIALGFLITFATTSFIFGEASKPKNVTEVFQNLEPLEFNASAFGIQTKTESETLGDVILTLIEDSGIEDEQLSKIYQNSTIKSFLSKKLSSLLLSAKNGDEFPEINFSEIEKLILENSSVISVETGYEITEKDTENILLSIQNLGEQTEIFDDLSAVSFVGAFSSSAVFLAVITAIFLIIICLGLINNSAVKALFYSMPSFILVGICILAFCIIMSQKSSFLADISTLIYSFSESVFHANSEYFYILGVVLLTFGIFGLTMTLVFKSTAKVQKI